MEAIVVSEGHVCVGDEQQQLHTDLESVLELWPWVDPRNHQRRIALGGLQVNHLPILIILLLLLVVLLLPVLLLLLPLETS